MHFGRYEQGTRLGAGAMGEVYKAWDPVVARWVALKFLKGSAPDLLARFQREAQAAARLDHPNIARIYETGEIDGRPFIAMEYVDGRTLGGRLDPAEAARVVRDAAHGVQAAHEAGVIHRDLKPGNLMVGSDGRVRVMDFGLARPVEEGSTLTKSGLMVGTPAYMSPEQARGEIHETDARSDVYGLGATLYDLLAGRAPFGGASLYDVVMKVASEEPVPPLTGVPAALAAVAMKCLEKRPADRYASAQEVADELDRFLRGEAVRAKRTRRLPRRAVVTAIGVVVMASLAGVAWRATRTQAPAVATEDLARSAEVLLEAALDLRRAGNVRGMKQKAEELEVLCGRVIERLPSSPEPHYQMGRMHRARMKFDAATAAQDRALKLDPGHAAARRERALLALRAYHLRMAELQVALTLGRSIQAGGIRGIKEDLAPEDEEAVRLREACERDLAELDPASTEVLRLVLTRAKDVPVRLREVLKGRTLTEDEILWVAWIERSANQFKLAEAHYTEGLSRDRGFVPLLQGRAEVRHTLARIAGMSGDPSAEYESALRDLEEAERLDPEADVRVLRAVVRIDFAGDLADHGGDCLPLLAQALEDLKGAPADNAVVLRTIGQVNLARGRELERRGGDAVEPYGAALAALDAAIRRDPTMMIAWRVRASVHMELAKWDGDSRYTLALRDAEEAVRLAGSIEDTWLTKASVQGQYALQTKDAARMRAAIRDASEAVRIAPTEPTTVHFRGVLRHRLAMFPGIDPDEAEALYNGAVEDLDELVKALGRNHDGWMRRAQALVQWGAFRVKRKRTPGPRFEQAAKSARKAAELAPWRAETRFECGSVLLEITRNLGERDGIEYTREALQEFEAALKARPGWVDAHRLRGQARLSLATQAKARKEPSLDFYEGAIDDFTRVLQAGPNVFIRYLRGRARNESVTPRVQAGKPYLPVLKDGIVDLEAHVAEVPDDVEGRYHLASACGALATLLVQRKASPDEIANADEKALAAWEKGLPMLPERAEAWFRRGALHFVMQRWKEAEADLAKAVALDDGHATARSLLEQCRKRHP